MEAKDLRIGNLVQSRDGMFFEVTSEDLMFIESGSNCKPIPLTEEWLVKFGFEKDFNGFYKLFKESEVPVLIKDGFWTCDGICFSVNCLYHVHQLQNLYFALTGEELTIKNK